MTPETRIQLVSITVATTIHVVVAAWLFGVAMMSNAGGQRSPADGERVVMISLLRADAPRASSPPVSTAAKGSGAPRSSPADFHAAAIVTASPAPARDTGGSASGVAQAAPAPAAAGDAALDPTEVQLYRDRLLAYIERYRRYPPEAQRNAVEGVVILKFTIDRQGQVRAAWIGRSSGSPILDNEAMSAIRRAAPLPPIPADWPSRLDVTLPIPFTLE